MVCMSFEGKKVCVPKQQATGLWEQVEGVPVSRACFRKPRRGQGLRDLRVGEEYNMVLILWGLLPDPCETGVIPVGKSLGL